MGERRSSALPGYVNAVAIGVTRVVSGMDNLAAHVCTRRREQYGARSRNVVLQLARGASLATDLPAGLFVRVPRTVILIAAAEALESSRCVCDMFFCNSRLEAPDHVPPKEMRTTGEAEE